MKKTFLICPVRHADQARARDVVCELERDGWRVHWPYQDTNQDDPTGLRICSDNRDAIADADAVHFMWDGKSQGCLFDLGVAFALNKPIVPVDMPPPTEGKSFQNMVRAWSKL